MPVYGSDFLAAAFASVYPRPTSGSARFKCFVELVVIPFLKKLRVLKKRHVSFRFLPKSRRLHVPILRCQHIAPVWLLTEERRNA
jgi:hypothetical protein